MPCFRRLATRYIAGVLLGQAISVFVTGTGVFSQIMTQSFSIHIPTTQSALNYPLLALIYGPIVCWRKHPLQLKWWWYAFFALVDVEANALVVKAYQYTNIASVMLLDCFTIPCVMLLAKFVPLLRSQAKYRIPHLLGVFLCLAGVCSLVAYDWRGRASQSHGSAALGDILVLVGAFLYAVSNVGQELAVKGHDRVEYLAMIGIFGTVTSFVQAAALEWNSLVRVSWSWNSAGALVGFVCCLQGVYHLTPILLTMTNATVLNLSLLTSDVGGLMAGVFLFHAAPSYLFAVSFVCVVIGVTVFTLAQYHDQRAGQRNNIQYSSIPSEVS